MKSISTNIFADKIMGVLSQKEIESLAQTSSGALHEMLRNCALATLNCGNEVDDTQLIHKLYQDFNLKITRRSRGIRLDLHNAPASAFVDGQLIRGIKEHLFAVIRDIVYIHNELNDAHFDLNDSCDITNAIFYILRNASILKPGMDPNLVICWGGHAISRIEYNYSKEVGHELGLRQFSICTGCGGGAMKGPMKGAAIGHAKQRHTQGRYLGYTEPGIIAAESPNPIINNLVIFPDIEKRLEAFVRTGHAFIVFPGGAGTAEEILYLLGILLHPENKDIPFPLIFTGPLESKSYFEQLDKFIGATLGKTAQKKYSIIIGDPKKVAKKILKGKKQVKAYRKLKSDSFYYNWKLKIEKDFQLPFEPSHQNMASLSLHRDQAAHQLAANLRKAFSGIVAGNVKSAGVQAIQEHGPFIINASYEIMQALDSLLLQFVQQGRMKLSSDAYIPCYTLKLENND